MSGFYLRPHHALCIRFFEGRGYSEGFVGHMAHIIEVLDGSDPEVTLTGSCDRICAECPHNIGGVCDTAAKTAAIDDRALSAMGLELGDTLRWRELSRLAGERIISAGRLKEICGDCVWIGICGRER